MLNQYTAFAPQEHSGRSDHSDPALIARALAGDHQAAQRLAARHRPSTLALAARALGNADDAQDVAQEALVYAHLRLGEVRDPARFAAWLRNVTLSLCADYRRRRGTRRLGVPLTALTERAQESRYAEGLAIRQAIARLSPDQQTALLLHHVGGWSQHEVAELLNIPLNTVRSRLQTAKKRLQTELAFVPNVNTVNTVKKEKLSMPAVLARFALSPDQAALLASAFPGAPITAVQNDIEPWQPFGPRVTFQSEGTEKTVDFRADLTPARAALLPVLERAGIPGPRVVCGPIATTTGYLSLCETPRGENLTLWALGGTPHRIRLATERAFEGIDRLQNATDALLADPVSAALPRRTLLDEIEILTEEAKWNADWWLAEEGKARAEWLRDPWFTDALARTKDALADINTPLVYTDYTFFFPQGYRIAPGTLPTNEPLGWPGDPHLIENPLVEFVYLWGHFGDPLLGLAMVWVYDCYPFVHTGFVEQFLWRRGVSRREFAPRLAIKALQMVARDLPLARPAEGGYWDALRGWVEQAIAWL